MSSMYIVQDDAHFIHGTDVVSGEAIANIYGTPVLLQLLFKGVRRI